MAAEIRNIYLILHIKFRKKFVFSYAQVSPSPVKFTSALQRVKNKKVQFMKTFFKKGLRDWRFCGVINMSARLIRGG